MRFNILFPVILAGFLCTSVQAEEQPSTIVVSSLTYAGSGCPAGSLATSSSDGDPSKLTLWVEELIPETGPDVPRRESRKNCQVQLEIEQPEGWTYAIRGYEVEGTAILDARIRALTQIRTWFGTQDIKTMKAELKGPFDDDFKISSLSDDHLVFAPCQTQRSAMLQIQVRLDNSRNRRGSAIFGYYCFEPWGGQPYTLDLVWKKCGDNQSGHRGGTE